jgi:hypothetical protein
MYACHKGEEVELQVGREVFVVGKANLEQRGGWVVGAKSFRDLGLQSIFNVG